MYLHQKEGGSRKKSVQRKVEKGIVFILCTQYVLYYGYPITLNSSWICTAA